MSRRTSFHISEQAEKVVAENDDQAKRINFIIGAYSNLLKSPTLSYAEWMTIIAAANGFVPAYKTGLDSILHSFATGIPYAALFGAEFAGVDKEQVAQKFWNLPKNQQLFVYELARKFWLPKASPISSYQEWLSENGAKLA